MTLHQTIKQLPKSAGIYQYFDKNGRLLYVGKAKNLAARVKSYWHFIPKLHPNPKLSSRIVSMLEQTVSLNYIVVKNEHDALILENSLIKQLNPKYNILLRDDKTYPYIYIDNTQPYPRFEITRKVLSHADIDYYGPFSVGARDILDSLYELCKLVQKKGSLQSKKLCLYHQINKCLGPCELPVTKERYQQEVAKARAFIKNKKLLIKELEVKMHFYAENLRFEEAKELRDRIEKIRRSEIQSDIDFASDENYDIFALEHQENKAVIVKIFMRHGKIISSSHQTLDISQGLDLNEIYSRVLLEFYKGAKPPIIAPILIAHDFEDKALITSYLSKLFEKKAHISQPKRGKKKQLIELALLNAKEILSQTKNDTKETILEELQTLCYLEKKPQRIEVFDNSHISGVATVGAMVVYDTNAFDKKSYRTYHLEAKDEYAQMRETLTRRIASFEKNPPPDLWILDGGATLLKLACELLDSAGIYLEVIAISKEKVDAKVHRAKGKAQDILYTKEDVFRLMPSDKRLQFVQRLRDEAHRCAINFHKKTKLKLDQESQLLQVHGISAAKIQKLLQHFGTFHTIRESSFEDICEVLNEKDAKTIKKFYT